MKITLIKGDHLWTPQGTHVWDDQGTAIECQEDTEVEFESQDIADTVLPFISAKRGPACENRPTEETQDVADIVPVKKKRTKK